MSNSLLLDRVPTKEEKDALLRDGASVDAFLSRKQDFDDRVG